MEGLDLPRPLGPPPAPARTLLRRRGNPRVLYRPRAVGVRTGEGGVPVQVDGRPVEIVRESWLVEDRWWTDRPLRRRYWEVVGVDGRNLIVFHDLAAPGRGWFGGWFVQGAGGRAPTPPYAELHCHSAYSFLDGVSLPGELAERAGELGYAPRADRPQLALRFHGARPGGR